ncbi:MAG: four helix bundle protein [Chitinophagales bacterium]|nr:four helix bundle protein [Chitinophagales bacterium]
MRKYDLKDRTKYFAIRVLKEVGAIRKTYESVIVVKQMIRSVTSVASNYRAACNARSDKEFFAKLCIVVEEADESLFWLEIIEAMGWLPNQVIDELMNESHQLVKIFNSSKYTIKQKLNKE